MGVLKQLEPQNVFGWFEAICAIPHGSGHISAIGDFLAEFGRTRNLETIQESCGNVIIKKPATAGYENKPTVILQGHMDMVCEKTPETKFDFRKEGLNLVTDGVKVWANGTTLGGDNGIAVAYALAILDSDNLEHPALEAVFTTDEEVGMVGATALDGRHLQGRMLLNLDSEEAGVLTVGCAGGARATITLPVQSAPAQGDLFQLDIGGLVGGHSGIDTGKGRGNANKLLSEALFLLLDLVDIRLCYLKGGAQNNAIARDATALFVAKPDQGAWIFKVMEAFETELHNRFGHVEPNLFVRCGNSNKGVAKVWSKESTKKVLQLLMEVPDGVQSYSRNMAEMVETSLNLGVISMAGEAVKLDFCLRSSVNRDCDYLVATLSAIANTYGGVFFSNGHYKAWEYRENSPLRDKVLAVYRQKFGSDMKVETIHAGLECGVFGQKLEAMDAVSMGPDLFDIHTPQESLSVASVAETYEFVLEILKNM